MRYAAVALAVTVSAFAADPQMVKASAELHVLAGGGHGFGMRAARGPAWGLRF